MEHWRNELYSKSNGDGKRAISPQFRYYCALQSRLSRLGSYLNQQTFRSRPDDKLPLASCVTGENITFRQLANFVQHLASSIQEVYLDKRIKGFITKSIQRVQFEFSDNMHTALLAELKGDLGKQFQTYCVTREPEFDMPEFTRQLESLLAELPGKLSKLPDPTARYGRY